MIKLLNNSLPKYHSRQTTGTQMAQTVLKKNRCQNVLDVGCGNGNSADFFTKASPGIRWIGVDINDSPEVRSRIRSDLEFHRFDGKTLPFGDSSFCMVYSNQVLEHVRYPAVLMKEMVRVLKPGGLLVGSTSHLEPYHSLSFQNYTPFGFKTMAEDAGLVVSEIRPGIDAFSLIIRRLLNAPRVTNHWWSGESPFNALIDIRKKNQRDRRNCECG